MVFTVLVFAFRKPGLSPADFKTHYETRHVPLLKSLAGQDFPKSHVRRYLQRSELESPPPTAAVDDTSAKYPATVMVGTQNDFGYDAFGELIFENEAAFQAFFAKVSQGEAAQKIAEDEEHFLDRPKMTAVVLGDTIGTYKS